MAKTTINASDLTLLRSANHVIKDVYLNTVTLVEITTLTITSVGNITPIPQVVVSGDMSSIVQGQMLRIFRSSELIATSVVRKAPSGSTLFIAPLSTGDSGYPRDIEVAISAGDTIKIYNHRPLWAQYSSIRQRIFYKSWDVPYSGQNSQPPPIANTGTWQHADLEGAFTSSFTLPRSGVNTSFALHGGALTYSWTLPTGVTLKAGYNLTDSVIEVDAGHGQHLVSLTITDSNSKTHTAYMWLFVTDGDSLGESYMWQVESDTEDRQGREIRLKVTGDNLKDVLYPQAPIMMKEYPLYDGKTLGGGVHEDTFIGYISSVEYTYDKDIASANVTVMSPLKVANNLPTPPQLLVDVTSPTNWTECTSVLSNPLGSTYYAIRWALPALFEMHDFDPYDSGSLLTSPRKKSVEYSVDNVFDASKRGADFIMGNIGSASDGTTGLRKHPSYRNNAYRNALPTIMTIGDDDVSAPLTYTRQQNQPLSELRGGGFAYDGTSIKAWMGIKRWYQGVGKETIPDFTVTVAEGLDGVLEIVGHALAKKHAEITEISLTLVGNMDVLSPVYLDAWVLLNIDSDYDAHGTGWALRRHSVLRVERQWDNSDGIKKTITITLEPETFGQPAEQFIIGNPNAFLSGNGWITSKVVDYVNQQSELYSTYLSGNTDGGTGITWGFNNVAPNWDSILPTPTGVVANVCVDYNSPYFAGNNIQADLFLYMAVIEDDEVDIYRVGDVLTAPYYQLLGTFSANDSTLHPTGVQIRCSETTPELCVCTYHDQTGVHFIRTTDGGANWTTGTVGNTTTDTSNDNAPIGLAIAGDFTFATGWDSSSSAYRVYRANGGGTFTLMANSAEADAPYPMLYADSTYLYASVLDSTTQTTQIEQDFDGGETPSMVTYLQTSGASITVTSAVFKSANITAMGSGRTGYGAQFLYDTNGAFSNTVNASLLTERLYTRVIFTNRPAPQDYKKGVVDYKWDAMTFSINTGTTSSVTGTLKIEILIAQDGSPSSNATASASYLNVIHRESLYDEVFSKPAGGTNFTWNLPLQDWITHEFDGTSQSFTDGTNFLTIFLLFSGTTSSSTLTLNVPNDGRTAGIYMDNIRFFESSGTPPALYRVSAPTSSDTWTDITPATDFVPRLPSALVSNITDEDKLDLVASDGNVNRWYRSSNAGNTWANQGTTNYRYFKTASDILVAGGDNALDLSVDSGATLVNKRGNLDAVLNPIGTHYYGIIIL